MGDQRVVRAFFDDAAVLHHENTVCPAYGREAVGDDERRTARRSVLDGAAHGGFTLGVERGGRLVQQQYRRVAHQRAGERDALALAAGEAAAFLAERGCEAVLLVQKAHGFGHAGGLLEDRVVGVVTSEADVFRRGAGEEGRLLRRVGKAPAPVARVRFGRGHTVQQDRAPLRIEKAQRETEHGRLARAAGADERDELAGLHLQREILQRRGIVLAIVEGHVLERQCALALRRHRFRVRRRGDLRRLAQHFGGPVSGAGGAHHFAIDLRQHAEAGAGIGGVHHHGGEIAETHLAVRDRAGTEPEHAGEPAEQQYRHQHDHQRPRAGAFHGGGEGGFYGLSKHRQLAILAAIGLDQFDGIQRLGGFSAGVGQARLGAVRHVPDDPANAHDGKNRDRQHRQQG